LPCGLEVRPGLKLIAVGVDFEFVPFEGGTVAGLRVFVGGVFLGLAQGLRETAGFNLERCVVGKAAPGGYVINGHEMIPSIVVLK
jgi:hypothetical protein